MKALSAKVVVSHPTGNQNCRSVLTALEERQALAWFGTMLGWSADSALFRVFPTYLCEPLLRRAYSLPARRIRIGGIREAVRLAGARIGWKSLIGRESGWASVDRVYAALDRFVAGKLGGSASPVDAVYAYEDGALQTFRRAKERGIRRIYELPIAYWETVRRLLREEEERLPAWASILRAHRDSPAKLQRKTEELSLANLVICPSRFVAESLPPHLSKKRVAVVPFGSPAVAESLPHRGAAGKVRVLFVGSLTQRKGLADLFQAIRLLKRKDIELVILGVPMASLEFYRAQLPEFIYEAPRSHSRLLEYMSTCDLFVLPSLVEGRALVIQEAMSRGLPVVITSNTGADDLIEDSDCGFVVPIRSPESIAEKISLLADTPELRLAMGEKAQLKAAAISWKSHGDCIWREVELLLSGEIPT